MSMMRMMKWVSVLGYLLVMSVLGACKKNSEASDDAGVGIKDGGLAVSSMCCGGKDYESEQEEGWCLMRCAKDSDCPEGCVCSCEAEECSAVVVIGVAGHSDQQCLSMKWLGWNRRLLKGGGGMR
jgi:hypothetical protein